MILLLPPFIIQSDQKVSVQLTITVKSSDAQRHFNHPVQSVHYKTISTSCVVEPKISHYSVRLAE